MKLDQITNGIIDLMNQNNYNQLTIGNYTRVWKKLNDFLLIEYQTDEYSTDKGVKFLEKQYNLLSIYDHGELTQNQIQLIRIIHLLDDYMLHGVITMRYTASKNPIVLTEDNAYFYSLYTVHLNSSGVSAVTVEHYSFICRVFLNFLDQKGLILNECLSFEICNDYIKTFAGLSFKTVEQRICGLRHFLRFLNQEDIINNSIYEKIHMPAISKQAKIPSEWKVDELKALLNVIDRNSPIGKRDYAMILTACLSGLRFGDIRRLKFENIDWANKRISIIQHKTGNPLTLPIPDELGWAIIDYIKNGRPQFYDTDIIFIKHMPPFDPISSNMSQTIKRYMNKAGIPISKNRHQGFHSLRHTAASLMLEEGTQLPVITEILGHSDTDITSVYLKTDITKLKECILPLTFEEDYHIDIQ